MEYIIRISFPDSYIREKELIKLSGKRDSDSSGTNFLVRDLGFYYKSFKKAIEIFNRYKRIKDLQYLSLEVLM